MLGLGGTSPVAGQADDVINCPISKAYEVIGKNFFENYPKWCPQIVELEQISPSPIGLWPHNHQHEGRDICFERMAATLPTLTCTCHRRDCNRVCVCIAHTGMHP